MHIHWNINRLDENFEECPADGECLIQIEGTIECDGQPAGSVDAFYLFTENPELPAAFLQFWDLDSTTCGVFEEIMRPDHQDFRAPLPDFVCVCPGILCVNFIALYPPFRRRGLGREVMRELVHLGHASPARHPLPVRRAGVPERRTRHGLVSRLVVGWVKRATSGVNPFESCQSG